MIPWDLGILNLEIVCFYYYIFYIFYIVSYFFVFFRFFFIFFIFFIKNMECVRIFFRVDNPDAV
jgi:hypothetical protein